MDKFLYIAMTGAKQNMNSLAVRANNLANANTDGFKADMEVGRSMQVNGAALNTRVYAITENPLVNYDSGVYKTTNRDLDIAVKGNGWIAVLDANGDEAYTRAGSLSFDATGALVNARGNPIMGDIGPITIPLPAQKVDISKDGFITVLPRGAPLGTINEVAKIKLVNPEFKDLIKGKDGLFRSHDGQVIPADIDVNIESGMIEGSNVNAISEMISLIDHQRQFEMQIKLMKTAEEIDKSSTSLMRVS